MVWFEIGGTTKDANKDAMLLKDELNGVLQVTIVTEEQLST